MSSLETHTRKARAFRDGAAKVDDPGLRVEAWFLSAYHFIEACAAKRRVHIQKHQQVPDELKRNPAILGSRTSAVVDAFRYLDHNARAKFVYGNSGTRADLERARKSFGAIVSICEEVLA